ncbi:MAG: glutathione S-transferase family protein [bacterium]|nr:glutathione S-transferase family protein [bacterium]
MGRLVDGQWQDDDFVNKQGSGAFDRAPSAIRDWVRADGSTAFGPQAGRYHLYLSWACPWAHRTLILRALKGLESAIGVSFVDALMGPKGWSFSTPPGHQPKGLPSPRFLHQLYQYHDAHYNGRVTVPLLWDCQTDRAVNNESSEIIIMLDQEFQQIAQDPTEYYPAALRPQIDELNAWIYEEVNNGVYRCGFAGTQGAYEEAFAQLFVALDRLEGILGTNRYLTGDRLTLADWRLFTTLIRFDAVYVGHFKCNLRRIADYPNLQGYLKELYQMPQVRPTVDFAQIKTHYYASHKSLNPQGIIPIGPWLDLEGPHMRG